MQILAFLLTFSCASKTPGATTPAAANDVTGVAAKVVEELPAWEGFTQYESRPRIVVMPTANHTKFDIDTQLATTKLVNGLIRVSGEHFDVVDPESWAQMAAQEPEKGKKEDTDTRGILMLQSEVRTTASDAGDGRPAVHVLVTYRLVESDTARAVWASDFEWTKAKGKAGYEQVSP